MFTLRRKPIPVPELKPEEKEEADDLEDVSEKSEDPDTSEASEASEASETSETSETSDASEEEHHYPTMEDTFASWVEEKIIDPGRRAAAMKAMNRLSEALKSDSADEEVFELIARASDYERAVADADMTGEIRGRNMAIEKLIEEEMDSDGVPHPQSSCTIDRYRTPSIFEIAREA